MPQAMIVSVGGSPEPLIKTLGEQRPQLVCFLASQESIDLVGRVKEAVAASGLSFRDHKVLVEDINNLVHCYQRALACADWVVQQQVPAEEVVVDYTGGTKTMTVALALATVSHGFRFSYVGGTRRTKGGLGVVESGSEEVWRGANPWQLFAIQEQQRLAYYFNSYQFAACRRVIQDVADRVGREERQRFAVLRVLVDGYEAWERFTHGAALTCLEKGLAELHTLANLGAEGFLASLAPELTRNLEFLRRLRAERRSSQDLHPLLLSDLLANAERRIEEGKYDDATARLYRLVEMSAQLELVRLCGVTTDNVPLEEIPESLRDEFVRRYRDERDGRIKLPLEATFRLLARRGNALGQRFEAERGRFSTLQQARNRSILAHGMTPIEDTRVQELRAFVLTLLPQREELRFPKLRIQ